MQSNFSGAPYSPEAEEAVIGSVMLNPQAYITLAAFLSADDFFLLRHQRIWEAFSRINARGDIVDQITLAEELENMSVLDEIGGRSYLVHLMNNVGTAIHAEVYGRLVERTAIRRKLLEAADKIKDLALDEEINIEQVLGDAEASLFNIGESQIRREFVPMWDAISAYYDRMEYMIQNRSETAGLPAGYRDLDQLLGGFQKSDLLIFAGRPGMGKCVAAGTIVSTEQGHVPIESLKPENVEGTPDDEGGIYYPLEIDVLTPDGIQKTSHFYDAGHKPTLKFATHLGYELTSTVNHRVLTLNKLGEKDWIALADLQVGDYVAVQSQENVISRDTIYRVRQENSPSSLRVLTPEIILPDACIWDEIISIEDAGIQYCYDLVVPETQSYIANGIVSHNTSWLLTTTMNAARFGARVAIFTMEMGVEQLVQRMVAMETGINVQKLRLGQVSPQEMARLTEAVGRIGNFNIFIDDTPAMSPMEMRTKCRRLAHEHGLDLVIVDYMQLMNAGGSYENNRVQEISFISRSLKELARELNVPLISAAQLSRAVEQRQDKRPVLSDLRESGCITGESLVYLPDCGFSVPIRDLIGKTGFRVMSVNTDTWKAEPAVVTNSFATGVKPVFKMTTALGRSIRATGNHKFLTIDGWVRLDELVEGGHIAVPNDAYCAPDVQNISLKMTTSPLKGLQQTPSVGLQTSVARGFEPRADGDIFWDKIVSIEPDGEEEVYDLTVEPNHSFLCCNIVISNSIEQDADIVMFLYRDEVYNEATEFPNQADVIVAKHRNGPTGVISLYFEKSLTKFMDASVHRVDLSDLE